MLEALRPSGRSGASIVPAGKANLGGSAQQI